MKSLEPASPRQSPDSAALLAPVLPPWTQERKRFSPEARPLAGVRKHAVAAPVFWEPRELADC